MDGGRSFALERLQLQHCKLANNTGQFDAYAHRPVSRFVEAKNVNARGRSKCALAFVYRAAIVYHATLARLQQHVDAAASGRAIRIADLHIDLTGGIDVLSKERGTECQRCEDGEGGVFHK